MRVPDVPCPSCPYRRDVPSGVWHDTEYDKLVEYDEPQRSYAPFHCHQENITGEPTVCRGWLSVHPETGAARLLVATGRIEDDDRYTEPRVPLFGSGGEAAAHGRRDIAHPGPEARAMIDKLGPRIEEGQRGRRGRDARDR